MKNLKITRAVKYTFDDRREGGNLESIEMDHIGTMTIYRYRPVGSDTKSNLLSIEFDTTQDARDWLQECLEALTGRA